MNQYRVCVAEDGKPLSAEIAEILGGQQSYESHWLTDPDRRQHPETPEEAKYVHYLNATDELGAYLKAQELGAYRKAQASEEDKLMGYRSDVVFAFYANPDKPDMMPAIKLWVEENWSRDGDPFIESHDSIITAKYDDVKWYDDYGYVQAAWEDIKRFEAAFDTEEYQTYRACWEFARVGEDATDLDVGGSMYREYRLDIQRSIAITGT